MDQVETTRAVFVHQSGGKSDDAQGTVVLSTSNGTKTETTGGDEEEFGAQRVWNPWRFLVDETKKKITNFILLDMLSSIIDVELNKCMFVYSS